MLKSDIITIIIVCILFASLAAEIIIAAIVRYTDIEVLKEKDFPRLIKQHAEHLELKRYINYTSSNTARKSKRQAVPLDAPERKYMGLITGNADCLVVIAHNADKEWLAAKCVFTRDKLTKMQTAVDLYNSRNNTSAQTTEK